MKLKPEFAAPFTVGKPVRGLLTTSILLLTAVSLSYAAHGSKGPQLKSAIPGMRSIALFGPNNLAGSQGVNATDALSVSLKSALVSSGAFDATTFSPRLPSIDRALNIEFSLSSADVQQPVTEPATALKLATAMGCDGYVLDEVDSYTVDSSSHAVSVTVSGNLYYTNNGASVRTFAVTGTALPKSSSDPEANVMRSAVNNAVSQIVAPMTIAPAPKAPAVLPAMGANS